jgi:ribonuclease R
MVGSGCFVALDSPFVDVMVKFEDLGADRYEMDESGLRAVGARSGDTVNLGDRMLVEITDVAMLRRTVYGKRIVAPGTAPNRPERPGKPEKDGGRGRGRNKGGAKPSRTGRRPAAAGPARPGRPGGKPQGSGDARQVQRKEKKFGKPSGGKKGGGGGGGGGKKRR